MNSNDLIKLLKARFCQPAWVTISECSDRTGFRNRAADLIALGIWPSRGLEIVGFEVKASRTDWLNELKNPAKADVIASQCDRWYLAVTDKSIVQPGELPAKWGLIVPHGAITKIEVEAELEKKGDVKRSFFMAMIRRIVEGTVPKDDVEKRVEAGLAEAIESKMSNDEWKLQNAEDKFKRLTERVDAFQKASGLNIADSWKHDPTEVGKAVEIVLRHGVDGKVKQLEWLVTRLREIADDVSGDLDAFKADKEKAGV